MLQEVARFVRARWIGPSVEGAASIEYAFLAALIALAIAGSVAVLGTELAGFFAMVAAAFP